MIWRLLGNYGAHMVVTGCMWQPSSKRHIDLVVTSTDVATSHFILRKLSCMVHAGQLQVTAWPQYYAELSRVISEVLQEPILGNYQITTYRPYAYDVIISLRPHLGDIGLSVNAVVRDVPAADHKCVQGNVFCPRHAGEVTSVYKVYLHVHGPKLSSTWHIIQESPKALVVNDGDTD